MLTLPIKKKWFDMICSGVKREEYRARTPYYAKRFKSIGLLDDNGDTTGKEAWVILRNGYGKDKPEIMATVSLKIGTGYPSWGAEEGEWYYVLVIHGFVHPAWLDAQTPKDGEQDA